MLIKIGLSKFNATLLQTKWISGLQELWISCITTNHLREILYLGVLVMLFFLCSWCKTDCVEC